MHAYLELLHLNNIFEFVLNTVIHVLCKPLLLFGNTDSLLSIPVPSRQAIPTVSKPPFQCTVISIIPAVVVGAVATVIIIAIIAVFVPVTIILWR